MWIRWRDWGWSTKGHETPQTLAHHTKPTKPFRLPDSNIARSPLPQPLDHPPTLLSSCGGQTEGYRFPPAVPRRRHRASRSSQTCTTLDLNFPLLSRPNFEQYKKRAKSGEDLVKDLPRPETFLTLTPGNREGLKSTLFQLLLL